MKLINLKGQLKEGHRVREVREGHESACTSLWNGQSATVTDVSDEKICFNGCFHFWYEDIELDIHRIPSWETLAKGDIIVDGIDGEEAVVLGVLGDLFWRSGWGEFDRYYGAYTIQEAKRYGYTLKGPAPLDDEIKKAIEVLEKHGRIVDGKIIKEV